jgi:hypothetical protein
VVHQAIVGRTGEIETSGRITPRVASGKRAS